MGMAKFWLGNFLESNSSATPPPMKTSIRVLRNRLIKYIREAQRGEEILITTRTRPIVKRVDLDDRQDPDAMLVELGGPRNYLVGRIRGRTLSQTVTSIRWQGRVPSRVDLSCDLLK